MKKNHHTIALGVLRLNEYKKLEKKIEELATSMERSRIEEYTDIIKYPKKLLVVNLLVGIAKGIGMALGFSIIAALLIGILQKMIDLPLIGEYIANLLKVIENYR